MTKLKRIAILWLSASVMVMTACADDPKAATEANFEKALNAHFAKHKECLRVGSKPNEAGIIQEFNVSRKRQDEQLPLFTGFADLGLLETVTYQKDDRTFSGKVTGKSDWIGFKISSKGQTFVRPAELDKGFFSTGAPQFCYGTPQVVKITNFTEPTDAIGVKASSVLFTYKLVDIASWTSASVISERFKFIPDRLANQNIEDDEDMVLTNNGWVHHSEFEQ